MAKITAATTKGGAKPDVKPAKADAKTRKAAEKRGSVFGAFRRYIMEAWAELLKVNWPTSREVVRFTGVVLLAIVVVAVMLFSLDYVFAALSKVIFNF